MHSIRGLQERRLVWGKEISPRLQTSRRAAMSLGTNVVRGLYASLIIALPTEPVPPPDRYQTFQGIDAATHSSWDQFRARFVEFHWKTSLQGFTGNLRNLALMAPGHRVILISRAGQGHPSFEA
jgi:hypothetical protein